MKNNKLISSWRISNIVFIIILYICLFSIREALAQSESVKYTNTVQSFSEWKFSGHLGKYVDKISEARILNKDNWNTIYPETEEAFRLKEDDKNDPNNGQWRGEFWGKYILSVIAAYHYYHDEALKDRIAVAVKGLLSTQDGNGYIGTYSHPSFVEGNTWNMWCSKYTLWGLIESWKLLGNDYILDATKRFADYLMSEVGPGKINILETGNIYGMPSSSIMIPMVILYKATGDTKYLEYAEYIVDQWPKNPQGLPDILNKGLSGQPVHEWYPDTDPYKWAKAYDLCLEGLTEMYDATGERKYLEAAKNIHRELVEWERSPVGTISFNDKIVGSGGLINTVSEICDAVYWNRFSFDLYKLTADTKYIEEIERTLYNSLLCAYNQKGEWGLRRLRMSHVHIPAPNHFLEHHHCCVDNLPRGLFQAAEAALISKGGSIYMGLFNDGEGSVKLPSGNKMALRLEGDFLSTSSVKATISIDKPEKFDFYIRIPNWSNSTVIKINNTEQISEEKNNWLLISRKWKNDDVIKIDFDISVRYETFDTKKANTLHHRISFYNKEWAKIKFTKASSEEINHRYERVKSLSENEALSHKPAVTFFYGPLALSRDVRITEGNIFAPVSLPESSKTIKINPMKTPSGIWKVFELNLGEGQIIKFCDFSSAGNTWDDNSKFNTWCILKN